MPLEALADAGAGPAQLLALLALSTLVSEDLACAAAGLLVAQGAIGFGAGSAACLAGIAGGDLLLFLGGRLARASHGRVVRRGAAEGSSPLEEARHRPVAAARRMGVDRLAGWARSLRSRLRRWVPPAALARGRRWFRSHGPKAVFLARFVPGSRLPTYVAAGLLGCPPRVFLLWLLLAAGVWTPLLVGLTALVGAPALAWIERTSRLALVVTAVVAALLVLLARRARRAHLS